jgi:protein-tyrosine phosphatase
VSGRSRELRWDGCLNVRDVGGHRTADGRETRFGAVVRADSIRALSPDGWRALADYGIRTAIDLRGEDECTEDPPGDVPVDVIRIPIPGQQDPIVQAWPSTREAYGALLARFGREFAGCVAAIGDAPPGGVVVHCAGGRDRTGLAVALLLRLVGVDHDAIAADHAVSDDNFAATVEEWIAAAPDESERERRRRVGTRAERTMADVLTTLESVHGDVAGYLRAGGATEDALARAAARLLAEH